MQSPPVARYLVPPRSKYSPQHRVLRHPQLPFLPQCQRPSFTPTQNKSKFTETKTSESQQLSGTSNGYICNNKANKIYYTPLAILRRHESLWKTCTSIRTVLVHTTHLREKRLLVSSFPCEPTRHVRVARGSSCTNFRKI